MATWARRKPWTYLFSMTFWDLAPLVVLAMTICTMTNCTHDLLDQDSYIATKVKLNDGQACVDGTGAERNHQDEWMSNTTACDRNICFHGYNNTAKYIVSHSCRKIVEDQENPDSANCAPVGDSQQPFPHCCPILVCDERQNITETTYPPCYDRATNYSCTIWNALGGCSSTSSLYNLTEGYCKLTCGFCWLLQAHSDCLLVDEKSTRDSIITDCPSVNYMYNIQTLHPNLFLRSLLTYIW